MSTGRIHENHEKSKSPSRFHSYDGTLPVRLPHSQQPAEAANLVSKSQILPKIEASPPELVEILPNICSCLLGLCGCGCGVDICSIIPKICSLLAGLCGSLSNPGLSSSQNHPTPLIKVNIQIIYIFFAHLCDIIEGASLVF